MGTPEPTKRPLRILWKIIAGVLLISVFLLPLLLVISISENESIVTITDAATPRDAQRVKRVYRQLELAGYFNRRMNIFITEEDINSFFKLATRGINRLQGMSNISSETGTKLRISIYLPENPFGDYINLSITLPVSSTSIELDSFKIGQVTLTGKTASRLMKYFSKQLLGEQQSDTLFSSVKQIRTFNKRLIVTYQPIQNLGAQLSNLANLSKLFNGNSGTSISPEKIHYYYSQLCQHLSWEEKASLAGYLQQAITLAAQRSDSNSDAGSENRAALIATAILFGSYRFNSIFQAVPKQELRYCQDKAPIATLADRKDLSLHFIYAAGIKILSDSQLSFAVGEFKELSDTLYGGSGFSFADLAADQAGIRFAELASGEQSGEYLQQQASRLNSEQFFFPDMRGLPEGITQQQFESQYRDVEGDSYQFALDEIKQRINRLSLYKNAP